MTGAVALGATAFLIDDVANKTDAISDSDDDSDDAESSDCTGDAKAAGETVTPAT